LRAFVFLQKPKGELVKCADMHIQQIKTVLLGQEDLEPPTQGIRGDQNQERAERLIFLIADDLPDQSVLKVRMKRTQDGLHRISTGRE
jgi:hypothetical protein